MPRGGHVPVQGWGPSTEPSRSLCGCQGQTQVQIKTAPVLPRSKHASGPAVRYRLPNRGSGAFAAPLRGQAPGQDRARLAPYLAKRRGPCAAPGSREMEPGGDRAVGSGTWGGPCPGWDRSVAEPPRNGDGMERDGAPGQPRCRFPPPLLPGARGVAAGGTSPSPGTGSPAGASGTGQSPGGAGGGRGGGGRAGEGPAAAGAPPPGL